MNIDNILKQLIEKHDLNTLELSRRTGIAQPVIYRLMNGETNNPKITTVCTLANYFGITVNQLIGESPLPEFDKQSNDQKHFEIPILPWEDAATWYSAKKNHTHTKTVIVDLKPTPHMYALIMCNASMEPLFPKGATLIINGEKKPQDHSYIIIKPYRQKQAIFRQLLINRDLQYLRPLNPDSEKYKMRLFDKKRDTYCGSLIQVIMNYSV